jgi:hypothetical protein
LIFKIDDDSSAFINKIRQNQIYSKSLLLDAAKNRKKNKSKIKKSDILIVGTQDKNIKLNMKKENAREIEFSPNASSGMFDFKSYDDDQTPDDEIVESKSEIKLDFEDEKLAEFNKTRKQTSYNNMNENLSSIDNENLKAAKYLEKILGEKTNIKAHIKFLYCPIPRDAGMINFTLIRNNTGFNRMYPKYVLMNELGTEFILNAKKRAGNKQSNFLISCKEGQFERKKESFVAKLRAVGSKNRYLIYDNGEDFYK